MVPSRLDWGCSIKTVDFCLVEIGWDCRCMLLGGIGNDLELVCDDIGVLFGCGLSYEKILC